jgi:hypothetical protein
VSERVIVEAREAFAVYIDGVPVSVAAGDRFYTDDPVVKGREQLFGELSVRTSKPPQSKGAGAARAEETTSAGPGSRRTITRKGGSDA